MAKVLFLHKADTTPSPIEKKTSLELGKMGEDLASRHLIDQGYVILEKNYRRGNLEIDLIALDGDELVVAEVKTRSEGTLLRPETAVDHRKRKALMKLANEYMKSHQREENIRFDIISIINTEHGPHIDHIKDAYNVFCY